MALLECKMCGGTLVLKEGTQIAECENCGREQTVPSVDDEKKLALFARANRLLFNCEFDKAAGIYESIVADFPTEGEAYWDLVLCKYGVEYVDDAASGQKIPTCHRSSFDSVMDDPNLEQALDFSDSWARRLRRDEAKKIEQVRKGIIEVSAKEEPYDIFICYKETDVHGDRTLDSVLAQDTYDALTERGYRVFFSRITLEDKLGVEYEPYIFAALNSAKLMLVFGTCEEHFNAVWVKNEWSRYLQLMAQDKTKHLIPCYKGVDPYDMPKPFARLQSQDLGKMGADQDLLRGVEKLLPRQKAVEQVVQQVQQVQQVVPAAANPNAEAMLKRGFMALEDGNWNKADEFFEKVLNYDAENAQAYIGKYLVRHQAASLDALQSRIVSGYKLPQKENLQLSRDKQREHEIVQKYAVPGYYTYSQIEGLLVFNLQYTSAVKSAESMLQQQKQKLDQDKDLIRARRYAQGRQASQLEQYMSMILDPLTKLVEQEKKYTREAEEKLHMQYENGLITQEKKIQAASRIAERQRDEDYEKLCKQMDEELAVKPPKLDRLNYLANGFRKVGQYKEAPQKLKKLSAEIYGEEQRLKGVAQKKQKREEKKHAAISVAVVLLIIAAVVGVVIFVISLFTTIIPGIRYDDAMEKMKQEQYTEAIAIFDDLGDFKDARQQSAKAMRAYCEKTGNQAGLAIATAKEGKWDESMQLWATAAKRTTVHIGQYHTAAIKNDGTVVLTEYKGREKDHDCHCDVSGWTDIVDVAVGRYNVVGLKSDGTVVCTGTELVDDVSGWTNIVDVAAGNGDILALKADGTVHCISSNKAYDTKQAEKWTNVVAVYTKDAMAVGLRYDGTVVSQLGHLDNKEKEVGGWTDIVDIGIGFDGVVGMKKDGTIVFCGNAYGKGTADWSGAQAVDSRNTGPVIINKQGYIQAQAGVHKDLAVAISVDGDLIVYLKPDGTVGKVGSSGDSYGRTNFENFTDIRIPQQ